MPTIAASRIWPSLQTISGTPNAKGTAIEDVRVNHRCADIRMAEQFLDRSNIVPVIVALLQDSGVIVFTLGDLELVGTMTSARSAKSALPPCSINQWSRAKGPVGGELHVAPQDA